MTPRRIMILLEMGLTVAGIALTFVRLGFIFPTIAVFIIGLYDIFR